MSALRQGAARWRDGGPRPARRAANRALSTRPAFILVGQRADDVASLRVVAGKGGDAVPVLETPIVGPRFAWPAKAPALAPDTEYELVFVFKDRAMPPGRQSIISRVPAPNPAAAALTLIRVD